MVHLCRTFSAKIISCSFAERDLQDTSIVGFDTLYTQTNADTCADKIDALFVLGTWRKNVVTMLLVDKNIHTQKHTHTHTYAYTHTHTRTHMIAKLAIFKNLVQGIKEEARTRGWAIAIRVIWAHQR